ncbi:BrnT family toxin [Deinococcus sp. Arct2-2]|uniref:BrnT family toxin n=1 Tax=Deinococcus sp. Arct2-2 TaxID=2568653 RepID=UPI0010A2BEE4|nr:BrnT family toxin [Deinococcus sp. Arct2-2]THF68413.1 BrnT family toxin [Deinococcus sp. Arct2-2]
MEFDWDEANEEHIGQHDVDAAEAEEALSDPDATPAHAHRGPSGDPRGAVVGQTEDGRYLFVVFIVRAGSIRVITARDATQTEKRRYRQR